MSEIRVTRKIDPKLGHDCDRVHIENYILREVLLPEKGNKKARKAIAIRINGRNLRAVAQPLRVFVGGVQVRYLKHFPNEQTIEGILLEEPEKGAHVEVILGDEDHARHPTPFDPAMIERI
ncbi:MAG: hypothetical protein ACFFCW_23820 [Candidatus Hodarchaeota archaeon]